MNDIADWCLRNGKGILADLSKGGLSESEAAGVIRKLAEKEGFGYPAVKEAILSAKANGCRQPVPYLRAILNRARDAQTGTEPVAPPKVAQTGDLPVRRSSGHAEAWQPKQIPRADPNSRYRSFQLQRINEGKFVRADDPRWAKLKEMFK